MENVPAVFAGNGFSPLRSRKNGKWRAVRHANKNIIEDNVNNGTERTKHISRITIWLIRSRRLMNRNNRGLHLLISRHDRTIYRSLFYPNQPGQHRSCQWISSLPGWVKKMLSLSSIWFFRSPDMLVPEHPVSHDIPPDSSRLIDW